MRRADARSVTRLGYVRCTACGVIAAVLLAVVSPLATGQVNFAWVTVGDPGNPGNPTLASRLGSVAQAFRIASTEVTNEQYVSFLNAVDRLGTNPNAIYSPSMASDQHGGGILFNAAAQAGAKYALRSNMAQKPVNYVSALDAMRFVNWLENGQGAADVESGTYAISNGASETRSATAHYFLPTQSEWYKAAYYDPTPGAGGGDNYWLYPTRSDAAPLVATATSIGNIANPGPNVVNFMNGAVWNGSMFGNVTTVGSAGPGSASYYGTLDQAGNVAEWTETVFAGRHAVHGGEFRDSDLYFRSNGDFLVPLPTDENEIYGFRIAASVPEPRPFALLLAFVLLSRRAAMRGLPLASS